MSGVWLCLLRALVLRILSASGVKLRNYIGLKAALGRFFMLGITVAL